MLTCRQRLSLTGVRRSGQHLIRGSSRRAPEKLHGRSRGRSVCMRPERGEYYDVSYQVDYSTFEMLRPRMRSAWATLSIMMTVMQNLMRLYISDAVVIRNRWLAVITFSEEWSTTGALKKAFPCMQNSSPMVWSFPDVIASRISGVNTSGPQGCRTLAERGTVPSAPPTHGDKATNMGHRHASGVTAPTTCASCATAWGDAIVNRDP